MKKLTKIFTAVVAGMFAFACATDATEDLGVQVGNGADGATIELSLSLEESRTQLGEKVGELYPLYWSAGDKISVNGVESGEAVINQSNPANATFAVVEAATYAVAYPAAPAGEVLFAEKQNHVAAGNTFASGVSTMYGYSENASDIQLNHLTGVLKIGVKGDAVLAKAQISTIDRAPIAGAFDIDFQTGELTATAASKSVIEYSFGEGLQLSADAQYIHVAVPAGEYDELYITLYEKGNSGNIMYATVKAGESKPLVAGNVREFNNAIVYVPNAKLFVIDSVEKLVAFKAAVEAEGSLAMDAILTEDIDMTGVEWTPIAGENYTNTIIGNGYAIKNLTAPLFDTTSASFKGLHIENADITITDRYVAGAMACSITATDTVIPVVENCSVSGTVTVNNANAASHSRYGALVGVVYGVKVSDCVNNATFTITKPYGEGSKKDVSVGGVIGWIREFTKSNAAITYSELNNCVNNGKVSFNDATTSVDNLYIGGLTASSAADNKYNMLCNNTNNGEVSVLSNCATLRMGGIAGYAKGTAVETDRQGDKNVNYGKVVIKSGSTVATTYFGGVIGVTVDFSHSNCHNYGILELEEGATTTAITIGGVCGQATATSDKGDTFVFHDCTNNAPINVLSSSPENTAGTVRIGGVTGYTQGDLRRVTNNKEGVITIGGVRVTDSKRAAAGAPKIGNYCVAGVCSYKTVDTMVDCTNHADIIMSGTINEKSTKTISEFKVSGIVCYTSKDGSGFVSDGTIKLTGTFNCEMQVAGSIGFHYNNISGAEIGAEASSTNIEVSGACNGGLVIGGVVGFTHRSLSHVKYDGTINITKDATIGTLCYIGGCVGKLMGDSTSPKSPLFQLSTNVGNIVINGTINCPPYVGALVGYAYVAEGGYTFSLGDLTNYGHVTVGEDANIPSNNAYICAGVGHADCLITSLANYSGKVTFNGSNTGGNTYVAGCVGDAPDGKLIKGLFNSGGEISCGGTVKTARLAGCAGYVPLIADCVNYGKVTFTGSATTDSHCCGITYYAKEMTNCKNGRADYPEMEAGKLEYNSNNGKSVYLGGLARQVVTKVEDCINYGNLYLSNTANGTIYVGGMLSAGNTEQTTATTCRRCTNKGNIYINADVAPKANNNCFVGGFTYRNLCPYVFEDCHNEGDIIVKENVTIGNSIRMGGFIGTFESSHNITFDSCSNSGDIIVNKGVICGNSSAGSTGYIRVGGIVGNHTAGSITVKNYVKNTGNIKMSAETKHSQNIMVGGLFAYTALGFTSDSDAVLINEGKVECDGITTKKGFRVGGVIGGAGASLPEAVSYVNTGDVTLTGTYNSAESAYVGGVFGSTSTSQANAKSFCTINAIGYTGVGAITGAHYTAGTIEFSNCAAGGTMNSKMIQIEEASGTIEEIGPGALTATNWYENFYGNAVEESVLTSAGCSLLNEAPSTAIPTPSEPEVTE